MQSRCQRDRKSPRFYEILKIGPICRLAKAGPTGVERTVEHQSHAREEGVALIYYCE